MKILHYFLGFPPYRSGGMTKFAYDLMTSQAETEKVFALWPGEIKSYAGEPVIREKKNIGNIGNFEIVNPLPVPLDEGITDFEAYTKSCDINIFLEFLKNTNPDVIHIHTLMGLYKEFITAAELLKIRTIYTSHDYFGLCPKVTFFDNSKCCENDNGCRKCVMCNTTALSLEKIKIMQSGAYRLLKDSAVVKKIRKQHRNEFFENTDFNDAPVKDLEHQAKQYKELRKYYVAMYNKIDCMHFNSSVAEMVFKKYVNPKDSRIVSLTHKGIGNNKNNTHYESEKLRILFLSPAKAYKGFYVLKKALDDLQAENKLKFELKVYSPVSEKSNYMQIYENGYEQSKLPEIFSDADVLAAPSVCYETFGFTVLEALSYGVPVIVSDRVGAKDIISNGGIIIKAGDAEAFKNTLLNIDIEKIRNNITENAEIKQWDCFLDEMQKMYKGVI